MADEKGVDDKILCVPVSDPAWNTLEKLDDLPQQLTDEITHFFSIYKDLEQKNTEVRGWFSREDAEAEIEEARRRYRDGRG
jgi:inorganic pyrophosphatase